MQQQDCVLELAIFTVKPRFEQHMPALRLGLREALGQFDGLIEYTGYSPLNDSRGNASRVFADLARWDSLESARRVARAFEQGDPHFAPYAQAIESIAFMEHLRAE